MRSTLQNIRTTGTTSPKKDDLLYGEIAVGMNSSSPRLWTKLTDDSMAEYVPKSYIDEKLSGSTYNLILNDDGSLQCVKNSTSEGFELESDGSLTLK